MMFAFDEGLAERILGFRASDAQLLEMITFDNDGDDKSMKKSEIAFRVLISRHHRAIQAAIRAAGARGAEDMEEAFSEVCLRIAKELEKHGLDRIGEREAPVKWIYTTAKNATIDYLRSVGAKRPQEGEKDTRPPEPVDPQDAVLQDEKADEIRKDIEGLPEHLREVALLQIGGYTRSEIAEILGIKLGTVDSRIGEIRRRLRHHREKDNGKS